MIFTMLLIFIFALYQYSIWFISLYLHCSTMLNILLFFVIVFFSVNYDAIKPRKRCTWSGGYGKNYLFSNFTSAIRPKKEVEPKYVHYGLLNSYMRGGSELFQNKTTVIRNLQIKRYLDKVKILIPSLSEQKTILQKFRRAPLTIATDHAML